MKKIFLLFTLLFTCHTIWAHDVEVDGIFYNLDDYYGTASVTFKGDKYDTYDNDYTGSVVIPNSIIVNGTTYPVNSLGFRCFYGCDGLTAITIPSSVTSLQNGCFGECDNLVNIEVDEGNTVLDSRDNCNAIIETSTNKMIAGCKNTTIPQSVTCLGSSCFYGCAGLTSIIIPSSVTSIESDCFYGCTDLTSITIPNSVTYLGGYCFSGCPGLCSITIPESVTFIGYGCFAYCDNLVEVNVEDGNTVYDSRDNCNAVIETSTNTIVAGCKNTTIPQSVTSLGWCSFIGCNGLTTISIPNSVTTLGNHCFFNCNNLEEITIPKSVTSLGDHFLLSCVNLGKITVEKGNTVYDSRDNCNAIIETSGNRMMVGCKNSTIPKSVTSIGTYCFQNCIGLKSIAIPESVDHMGGWCFMGCTGLVSITIPNSVKFLGSGSFQNCTSLNSATLSNSLQSLEADCFKGCTSLTSITIPKSVEIIKGGCFGAATYPIYCYENHYEGLKSQYGDRVFLIDPTGIDDFTTIEEKSRIAGYYDQSGRRLTNKQHGLNIIRYSNGLSRKFIVK